MKIKLLEREMTIDVENGLEFDKEKILILTPKSIRRTETLWENLSFEDTILSIEQFRMAILVIAIDEKEKKLKVLKNRFGSGAHGLKFDIETLKYWSIN